MQPNIAVMLKFSAAQIDHKKMPLESLNMILAGGSLAGLTDGEGGQTDVDWRKGSGKYSELVFCFVAVEFFVPCLVVISFLKGLSLRARKHE